MMTLSICLVTRNAEARMERVLGSVAGLGAEVIVADTGSTDATMATARALGPTVVALDWQDDFGAAQNQALDQATGDWVFWINPDEELLLEGREQLPALLARPEALAYMVRVQEIMDAGHPEHAVEMAYPRLFRRHPELRFAGRVHPHFAVALEDLAHRENKQIYPSDLTLRHHAYLSVATTDKVRWVTRLLELELKDRPGQLHYLIEYGRNLLRLNDAKGHLVLAEASELVLAASAAPGAPAPTVASLLEYLLTVSPEQSRSRITPADARRLALRWFGRSAPLLWVLAQGAFQAGDFQGAAGLLEKLVDLRRTGTYDRSAAFDASIMAEPALLNLARCYVRLGDLDRAEWYFQKVFASPTHQAEAREGYALVQGLRRAPPKPV